MARIICNISSARTTNRRLQAIVMNIGSIRARSATNAQRIHPGVLERKNLRVRLSQSDNNIRVIEDRIRNLRSELDGFLSQYQECDENLRKRESMRLDDLCDDSWVAMWATVEPVLALHTLFSAGMERRADWLDSRCRFRDGFTRIAGMGFFKITAQGAQALVSLNLSSLNVDLKALKSVIHRMVNIKLAANNDSDFLRSIFGISYECLGSLSRKAVIEGLKEFKKLGKENVEMADTFLTIVESALDAGLTLDRILNRDIVAGLDRLYVLYQMRDTFIANGACTLTLRAVNDMIKHYHNFVLYEIHGSITRIGTNIALGILYSLAKPVKAAFLIADIGIHTSGLSREKALLDDIIATSALLNVYERELIELTPRITSGRFTQEEFDRATFLRDFIASQHIHLSRQIIEMERLNISAIRENAPLGQITTRDSQRISESESIIRWHESYIRDLNSSRQGTPTQVLPNPNARA